MLSNMFSASSGKQTKPNVSILFCFTTPFFFLAPSSPSPLLVLKSRFFSSWQLGADFRSSVFSLRENFCLRTGEKRGGSLDTAIYSKCGVGILEKRRGARTPFPGFGLPRWPKGASSRLVHFVRSLHLWLPVRHHMFHQHCAHGPPQSINLMSGGGGGGPYFATGRLTFCRLE